MVDDHPTAFEFFNAAVDAFRAADPAGAVFYLRSGFFENLYIAPLLLGQDAPLRRIWYPGAQGEPRAATEYVKRYGRLWQDTPDFLQFLDAVWGDSLVRAELRSFINLSRNLLNARTDGERADLLRERELFLSPERLRRTQSEILRRLESTSLRKPVPRPCLGLILLASRDPGASVEFYQNLLEIEPVARSSHSGGCAEFEFEGVHFAIHGRDAASSTDAYALGPPPASFGWGAIFVFRVADFDRYYGNAISAQLPIVDRDLAARGHRFVVLKDPSGYLVEITEEEPRGFEAP